MGLSKKMKAIALSKIQYFEQMNNYGGYFTPMEILYLDSIVDHGSSWKVYHSKHNVKIGKSDPMWFYFTGFKENPLDHSERMVYLEWNDEGGVSWSL